MMLLLLGVAFIFGDTSDFNDEDLNDYECGARVRLTMVSAEEWQFW